MKTIKLAFEEYGESAATPLILIHGFFASSRNWRLIAKKLAEHYHVYVLDMRNHGQSPHAPEMDYPAMAEDLKHFMDEQKLSMASLLGHSMGGKVAMWFALTYPEKVDHLIVADISPVTYQHSFDDTINALKRVPLGQISNRKQADDLLSMDIPELSYRQFLLQNLQLTDGQYKWRVNLDYFYQSADNIIAFPSVDLIAPYLGRVLFIMGDESNYTDKNAIALSFPNAEISTLKQAGHWLHIDKPAEFLNNIVDFL